MPGTVNGWTVAYTAIGGLVMWSGIAGTSLSATVKGALAGQSPTQVAQAEGLNVPAAAVPAPATAAAGGSLTVVEAANKATGQLMAASYGWVGPQLTALNNVVAAESNWNNTAQNPGSTAYGIGQFLDTTWSTVGYSKTSDPVVQIAAMLAYIKQRYGTPEAAWAFHVANGYY